MITVNGLTKKYAHTTAVDQISFRVKQGQIVGFLGPNGAGKTTTMRMLTCFLTPTSGTATVAGFDILEQPLEVKKRIGYLPETPPVYPEMRIVEYLSFVGQLKGLSGSDLRARVDYACERCAVADVRNKIIGKLSKGYRQRVGLAQAIIHNPDVLILDEPTAGLDPKADQRDARPDQEPRGRSHDHPEHAHPSGSQPDVRAGDHHQQGQDRGDRFGEQSAAARALRGIRAGRSRGPQRQPGSRGGAAQARTDCAG